MEVFKERGLRWADGKPSIPIFTFIALSMGSTQRVNPRNTKKQALPAKSLPLPAFLE